MNIVVTGAAGLIGSHLCDLLIDEGHCVIGIDNLSYGTKDNLKQIINNKKFTFIIRDVKTLDITCFKDVDIIVHLAAYKKAPKDAEISAYDVMLQNFCMMEKIIENCVSNKTKLVFSSTSDIYGNSKTFDENEPITIGPPTVERYSYALSKLFDEQAILNLVNFNKLHALIFRIFGCFSERSNRGWSGGHIPKFIDNAIKGKDIEIHGDGLQTRSMCDAIDIANGIYLGIKDIDNLNGEIINIGTDEEMSVKKSAELIINKTGSNSKIIYLDKKEIFGDYREIERRYANTAKAERLIKFKTTKTTEEVIDRIIKTYN